MDQKTGAIGQFPDCFSEVTSNLVVQHTGAGIVIGYSAPRIGGSDLVSGKYVVVLHPVRATGVERTIESYKLGLRVVTLNIQH